MDMNVCLKVRRCSTSFSHERLRSCPENGGIAEVASNREMMGKLICISYNPVPPTSAKRVNMLQCGMHMRSLGTSCLVGCGA